VSTELRLTLPYGPGKNQMWRAVAGRVLLSREARAYFAAVARQLKAEGVQPMAGPLAVQVDVYRPRRAGDLDGRLPAVLDALNGHAWNDDSQVVRLVATRHDDKAAPRVEVSIAPAEFEPTLKSKGSLKLPSNSAKPRRLSGPSMAQLAVSAALRPIARPVCVGCRKGEHGHPWDRSCVCLCHEGSR
jgi:Holliday junction resolvase RusA-like endonuclease